MTPGPCTCSRDIAACQSAATETRERTFIFPGTQSETKWLVCLLPGLAACLGIFLCTQQKRRLLRWEKKKAAFSYHTERGERNLADRKAALPAVLSDFG